MEQAQAQAHVYAGTGKGTCPQAQRRHRPDDT